MKILLSAFDPFGNDTMNPALEVMKRIDFDLFGVELIKLEVPTIFHRSIEVVKEKIRSERPDAVLALGQAGGRTAITVERVAINISDAGIADNAGYQPTDETIVPGGPAAYFSTLPIKAIVEGIKKEGLPAAVSNSAGTFVCNHLIYGILHMLETEHIPAIAGFIHLPFIPEQVTERPGQPSMSLPDIKRGIEAALKVIAEQS